MSLAGEIKSDRPLLVVALPEEATCFDTDLPILFTGVGKVCAALSVTAALARSAVLPSEIINLGTAGALHAGLSGTHVMGLVMQHDFASHAIKVLTGKSFGEPIPLGDEGLTLATGDVFVSDPLLRAQLAQSADLVDMEGYAVAAAAIAFGVPVRIVKHVSDEADDSALASWTSTVEQCSSALAAWLSTS